MLSLEYVAGLFDGEGCIRVATPGTSASGKFSPSAKGRVFPSYQVIVSVENTYEPVVRALHEQFGGKFYRNAYFTRLNRLNRIIYHWRALSKPAYAFLILVRPFLIIKREEADWAIALQEHIDLFRSQITWMDAERKSEIFAYRKTIADRIKALKKVEHDSLSVGDGPVSLAN